MKIAALVMKAAFILPCNNLIHDGFLFAGGSPKIDAGGLNAFVSHQVGKKSDIGGIGTNNVCIAPKNRLACAVCFDAAWI